MANPKDKKQTNESMERMNETLKAALNTLPRKHNNEPKRRGDVEESPPPKGGEAKGEVRERRISSCTTQCLHHSLLH
ncbi:hypothetical protein GIW81_11570 [Hyphomicrobium sp. xq]|uniref:Uncharacterized protein n=1 Tax=Hyphomicrobium album TaxID=2665159 RepID=A0A6I3KKJ6_9HYPH|nr:hypothetical protein [Hyphomicrobium album]MTD94969.1 hypothetical protein [Hyphomicrobium album]